MSKAGVKRPGVSRGAVAASLMVHAVLLTLLAWTAPALRLPTADWRPDVVVSLAPSIVRLPSPPSSIVAPQPTANLPAATARPKPTRPAELKAPRAPTPAAPPRPAPAPAQQPAAPAPAAASAPAAPGAAAPRPGSDTSASSGDPRGAVREAIGCSHEVFLRLNAAERAACDRKLAELPKARGATVDTIPPLKRGAYDRQAAQDARRRDHEGAMPNPITPCEPGASFSNLGVGCLPASAMHGLRFGSTPRGPAPDGS